MSLPDAAASAALDAKNIKPVWFAFLDFVGDPGRANTSGANLQIVGSGQPNLDGTYLGIDCRIVEVSPIKVTAGGMETVTARLSGLRGLDDDDRAMLADPANWQGRLMQLWRMIRDQNRVQQGGIQHYYTGYMMSLMHLGSTDDLTIEITVESYLAAFSQASNATYLSQDQFDPGDLSALATLAIANGNSGNPLTGNTPSGSFGPGYAVGGGLSDALGHFVRRL